VQDEDQLAGYHDPLSSGTPPRPAPPVDTSAIAALLSVAVAAFSVAALYIARDVLIPITLAVMLSFILSPLVNVLRRRGLWRGPSVLLSVLAALGVIGLVGTLIGSQVAILAGDAPKYAQAIEQKVSNLQTFAESRLAAISSGLTGKVRPKTAPASKRGQPAVPAASQAPKAGPEAAATKTTPLTIAKTILAPVLGPLETTFLVLIVTVFVLMQKEDLRDRFIRLFGSSDLHRTTFALDDAGQRLSRYFLSQFAVNSCFGIVIGLGLWAIGIPSTAMWGILAGMLRFVPYVGSLLAAVAPVALGAAIDPGWWTAIYVIALFFIVEPLTGYVVEPMLYGHSTGLSPISVIVSAIFWTWIWGPVGLILSTPLTLCLVVMGRHVKSLGFFDIMLGDRPALSPVASFYQRMLADNPDEALDQAEAIVADKGLPDFYHSVVLPGLKLAAQDVARGTISRDRAIEMTRSVLTVIEELSDYPVSAEIVITGPLQPNVVACIAGPDPFDAGVAAMVAQLLKKDGMVPKILPSTAFSREAIGRADLSDVDAIALCYLELHGSPAHLRYLVKRLRTRFPNIPIIAGLWQAEEGARADPNMRRVFEANGFSETMASFADTVGKAVLRNEIGLHPLVA
jgi:predicted PurR-regulated permease PerM